MEKTYGGHTVAALREFLQHGDDTGETIDELTGDESSSANIIRDLLAAIPSDAAQAPIGWKPVPTTATNEMLIALLSGGEADALAGCKDGYIASRLLEASGVAARFSAMLTAAPVAPAAAAPSDDLRKAVISLELTALWLDGGCDPARASTEIRAALDRIRPLLAAAQQGDTQS